MKVVNHKLEGEGVLPFRQTPNVGGKYEPDTIIIHYTAGSNAESAIKSMLDPKVKSSAHLCVARDGKTTQLADFNVKTNHAGKSAWGGRKFFNNYSIGIEIDNPGFLEKKGDKYFTYWGKEVPAADVFEGTHRNNPITPQKYWHKYPEAQIKLIFDICKALCETYKIKHILGHEEIGVYDNGKLGRKQDPGPAFPLDDFRLKLLGSAKPNPGAATATVPLVAPGAKGTLAKANAKVNVRIAPNPEAEKAAEPVEAGEVVEIIKDMGEWAQVMVVIDGWVSKQFIKEDDSDGEFDAFVDADTLNIRKAPGGEVAAKALTRGTEIKIVEDKGEWLLVYARIPGYIMKKFLV